MIKSRIRRRISFITTVRFGPGNPPGHTSYITDFSDQGTHVKTNRVYRPGTKLNLIIVTPDKNYAIEGIVIWAKAVPLMVTPFVKHGMGIKFKHANRDLSNLYQEKLKEVFNSPPIL
jgi:Tfp pilus assembly protein PilZ